MGVRVTWEGSPQGVCVFCFVPREVAKEKAGEVPITQRYMIPSLKEPGTHPQGRGHRTSESRGVTKRPRSRRCV